MLGVQEDLGSIAAGKLGDVVVLNGNPLQDIRQTANIAFVIKGGRVRRATRWTRCGRASSRTADSSGK